MLIDVTFLDAALQTCQEPYRMSMVLSLAIFPMNVLDMWKHTDINR